jgi:hypothetical protein
MQTRAIRPSGDTGISLPKLGHGHQYESLCVAKRGFLARLFGRPAITKQTLGFAELVQARMSGGAKSRGGGADLLEGFCQQHFSGAARELLVGDSNRLFRNATAVGETHAAALAKVLTACTRSEVVSALTKAISDHGNVSTAKATERAHVVYTAFVAQAARHQDRQAGKTVAALSKALEAVEFLTDGAARHDELTRIADQLGSSTFVGSETARVDLGRKLAAVRATWAQSGSPEAMVKALTGTVTLAMSSKALDDKLTRLTAIENSVALAKGMPAPKLAQVHAAITSARSFIGTVKSRDADQAALDKELQALGSTTRTPADELELAKALGQLDKASDYVAARQALDHIRATVTGMGQSAILKRLCEWIRAKPDNKPDVRDQTYQLALIGQGDPDIIDMIFKGADWHDDAWRLKAAVVAPGDERALKNLDVQHNLRIVASELDRVMQNESLRGKDGAHLPRNVFGATLADPKLIGWFMRHAPGIVGDHNLVIANWISLSCYDSATGRVDANKTKPLFDSLRLQGLDPSHIEQYIQQGFRNSAAVVKCREQVCKFARALESAKLLTEMEQARSIHYRAEKLTQNMLKAAIGVDPAGMSDIAIAEKMQAELRNAVAFATKNTQADLAALTTRRDALVTQIKNGANKLKSLGGDAKLDLFDAPGRITESVTLYQHALDALADQDTVDNPQTSAADKAAAAKGRDEHLAALKFFNILKLRENTDVAFQSRERGPKRSIENLRKVKDELLVLLELAQVESNIEVTRAKQTSSSTSDLFVKRAMRVAVLQEAVASGSDEFTPKDKAGAILKRMAAFGFQVGTSNEHMSNILRRSTEDLMQNTKSLAALCTLYEAEEQVRDVGKRVAGKTGPEPEAAPVSDVDKKRAENAGIIRNQLKELAPNTSFAIRYGTFGEVTVSLPVFVGVSVSGQTRAQRDNAIVISHDDVGGKPRYSLKLVGGASVRQGVSVSAIADLLSVKGHVSRGSEEGYSFTFDDRDACMNLALALASGDAADPRVWTGAKIQTEQSANKGVGASINASLDLGVLALEAQAQIKGSREVTVQTSAFGRTETYGRHFEATASASATLIGDLGAKDTTTGVDRTVSRSLTTYLGMFAPDCALNVSAKLINGNLDACLKYVLPPALKGQIETFKAQLEGVEDGTQVFVRCRLDPTVRASANALLGKAEKTLLEATLIAGDNVAQRRQVAKDAARALVVKAYALTAKPEAYIPEGLGWTTQALVEVTSSRKAFDYFASSEALETRFIPFDAPAGLLRNDVEV